jgi:hypothetical protein
MTWTLGSRENVKGWERAGRGRWYWQETARKPSTGDGALDARAVVVVAMALGAVVVLGASDGEARRERRGRGKGAATGGIGGSFFGQPFDLKPMTAICSNSSSNAKH